MTERHTFLVEIGTEELPPKDLRRLSDAFAAGFESGLKQENLDYESLTAFATPRRLALRVTGLAGRQPDREVERRGPPVKVAFDDDGKPTRAATAFARGCQVEVASLERLETPKGAWLVYRGTEAGATARELLPALVEAGLGQLPIARRMRWGSGEAEFVRPVHWLVMLLGDKVLDCEMFGVSAGATTYGHRFHAPGPIAIGSADDYPNHLEAQGHLIAGFAERRQVVAESVTRVAAELGGTPVMDDALLDEVTALAEWPVALGGRYDDTYLELPREVLIATLQSHQRYFPVEAAGGELLPWFVTVSNLASKDPEKVRQGNERVVRPRLADAQFFWNADCRSRLADHLQTLQSIVFERRLGSIYDKTQRVVVLAAEIAGVIGASMEHAERGALLSKCDLVSAMVGEFPELQGIMGRHYALKDGEPDDVALAIQEHYQPRFAGDSIPSSTAGRAVAVADKLDTLAGIFAIGKRPTGTRDPYGLRRAALGVVRILIEGPLDVSLTELIGNAVRLQPVNEVGDELADHIYQYVMERLRAYYLEDASAGIGHEQFDAVLSRAPASPLDFHQRLQAVGHFMTLDQSASLSAANKRVANILRQAGGKSAGDVDEGTLRAPQERRLYSELRAMEAEVAPLLQRRDYTAALTRLAALHEAVDEFFDAVMVMDEDPRLRENRLALLAGMRDLFLEIADLSLLKG